MPNPVIHFEIGGTTVIPPTEVPGRGWFAWFAGIDGNTIGLWKDA